MVKIKKPTHEDFESVYGHEKFTKIADSMLDSAAWRSLTPAQMGLYLLLKRRFTKNKKGETNQDNIVFPYSAYSTVKTYGNKRTFWRDLDALIETGFVRVVVHGHLQRVNSVYGFSEKWKDYGTTSFLVYPNERRARRPRGSAE